VIEEKYGFNTQTKKQWIKDFILSIVLGLIMQTLILAPLLIIIVYLPEWWWLPGFITVSLIEIIIFFLYPVLIAPLFNKFTPVQDGSLAQRLIGTCRKAGITVKEILAMDGSKRSRHSNAYFTGLGNTKRIVLYDTLINSMTQDEIDAVCAHEAGHWKKKHILKGLVLYIILTGIGFFITGLIINKPDLYDAFRVTYDPDATYAGLLIVLLLAPLVLFFIQPLTLWYSRSKEYEADQVACEISTAQGMETALYKLFEENLSPLFPHPLYIVWNYSHPPFLKRIERLQSFEQNSEG
jgi:STE24 endopeptidase